MNNVFKDIRFGTRLLLKRPGETAIAVLALGVGIGLTATMFSVVHGIYFRELPFDEPQQLIQLDRNNLAAGIQRMPVWYPDYLYWREEQSSFQEIAAWYGTSIVVSGMGGHAEHCNGAYISSDLFRLVGVQPAFGRSFELSDEALGGEPVVIISTGIWRNRYNSDPDILGQAIRINGEMMTVVGVMPDGFRFPLNQDFWLPLRLDSHRDRAESRIGLQALGRLKENVSLEQAQAELDAIARQLAAEYPATNEGIGITARHYIDAYTDAELRGYLNIMLAVVFGVLVIACANVANLLLGRAALRVQELAVRQVLGAGRLRLILQLLVDSLLVAGTGGVLGLVIAHLGAGLIHKAVEPFLRSFWIDIRVDTQVLWFVIGVTLLASLLAGLLPAIRASGGNVNEILKDQARGSSSLRMGKFNKALVVAQITLSCGLLVPTALMLKSIVKIKGINHGYTTDNLLYVVVGLPTFDYPDEQTWTPFFDELMRRLEAIPEARRVAFANGLPTEPGPAVNFAVEGLVYPRTMDYPQTQWVFASPELFEVFNIPLIEGRIFMDSDDQISEPVAVINQSLAERHFQTDNPLGRRIRLGDAESGERWLTIIGIVADSLKNPLPKTRRGFLPLFNNRDQDGVSETVYLAARQRPSRTWAILIRTEIPPLNLAPKVWTAIAAIDPDVPTVGVTSMADRIAEATWDYRLFSTIFSAFGFVALFLAMIGLYAVMALSVRQRTHELGLRMALGAQAADALKLIMADGFRQVGLGIVLGLGIAAILARLLAALLFRVEPWDFTIFFCVAALLVLTALLACFAPARWASRVAPMVAIRYE